LLEAFRTGDAVMIRESVRTVLQELLVGESPVVVGFEAQRRGCVK
jgi:hypothetical protein